jgi:hypothetical protein
VKKVVDMQRVVLKRSLVSEIQAGRCYFRLVVVGGWLLRQVLLYLIMLPYSQCNEKKNMILFSPIYYFSTNFSQKKQYQNTLNENEK